MTEYTKRFKESRYIMKIQLIGYAKVHVRIGNIIDEKAYNPGNTSCFSVSGETEQ